MKQINLISYLGGTFGEFLCSLISADDNYYAGAWIGNPYSHLNRFAYNDYLEERYKITVYHEDKIPSPMLRTKQLILQNYNQIVLDLQQGKNICAKTHYYGSWNIPLPNLRKLRLYVPANYYRFPFLLKIIKGWAQLMTIDYEQVLLIKNHSFFEKIKNRINLLPVNAQLTCFQHLCLMEIGNMDTKDGVSKLIKWFRKHASLFPNNPVTTNIREIYKDWHYINAYDLVTEPSRVMPLWITTFDLARSLDIDAIQNYHTKNLDLIHDHMGHSMEAIYGMNADEFVDMVSEYLDRCIITDVSFLVA